MKNRFILTLIAALMVVGLTVPVACSSSSPSQNDGVPAGGASQGSGSSKGSGSSSEGFSSIAQERMIIRTGNIDLVVTNVTESRDAVVALAERLGGYAISSSFSGKDKEYRGSVTVRVPDDKFLETLAELRKLGIKVQSESTSSQDVTEEYIDLSSRLRNAQATESQYLALLEKAATVEDILRVQESLSKVRSEIEQITGRMQYLERQTSMSVITVYLEPDGSESPLATAGWDPLNDLRSAYRGLISFLRVVAVVLIWLLIFSPVWGGIIAIIYFVRRARRRRRATT